MVAATDQGFGPETIIRGPTVGNGETSRRRDRPVAPPRSERRSFFFGATVWAILAAVAVAAPVLLFAYLALRAQSAENYARADLAVVVGDLISGNVESETAIQEMLEKLTRAPAVAAVLLLNERGEILAARGASDQALLGGLLRDRQWWKGEVPLVEERVVGPEGNPLRLAVLAKPEFGPTLRILAGIAMAFVLSLGLVLVIMRSRLERLLEPVGLLADTMAAALKESGSIGGSLSGSGDQVTALTDGVKAIVQRLERRERQLAANERRYRWLLDTQSEFVCHLDPTGRVLFANRAFESCAPTPIGQNFSESAIPDDRPLLEEAIAGLHPDQPSCSLQYRAPGNGDCIRWIQATFKALYDENDLLGYLAVGLDISEQKMAEQEVVQASKLASLGEMSASMAHELAQPISVIFLATQSIANRVENADPQFLKRKTERILGSVQRLNTLIKHLRVFSRPAPAECVLFDPREAIRSVLLLAAFRARKRDIRIHFTEPDELVEVRGHPILFEQVLLNLLANSIDAFSVQSSRKTGSSRIEIELQVDRQKGTLSCIVSDNAGGVAEEDLERMFEPFYTTKASDKGTGLGLAIGRNLIKRMGGSLKARRGTEGLDMFIEMPLAQEAL